MVNDWSPSTSVVEKNWSSTYRDQHDWIVITKNSATLGKWLEIVKLQDKLMHLIVNCEYFENASFWFWLSIANLLDCTCTLFEAETHADQTTCHFFVKDLEIISNGLDACTGIKSVKDLEIISNVLDACTGIKRWCLYRKVWLCVSPSSLVLESSFIIRCQLNLYINEVDSLFLFYNCIC